MGQRTASMKVFPGVEGRLVAQVFSGPVHFRDVDGVWRDMDTRLVGSLTGRLANAANSFRVEVAAVANAGELASLTLEDGRRMGFTLEGASPVPVVASGSVARYVQALPGVDVELTSSRSGLKEDLVLAGPTSPTEFAFRLNLTGLTARVAADGGIDYVDDVGDVRARTPAGFAIDSAGETTSAITYTLQPNDQSEALLRVSVAEEWLADPARVWPVRVDPSFVAKTFPDDTFTDTRDGYDWRDWPELQLALGRNRALMHFDFTPLNESTIGAATLYLYQIGHMNTTRDKGLSLRRVTEPWGLVPVGAVGPAVQDVIGTLYTGYLGSGVGLAARNDHDRRPQLDAPQPQRSQRACLLGEPRSGR